MIIQFMRSNASRRTVFECTKLPIRATGVALVVCLAPILAIAGEVSSSPQEIQLSPVVSKLLSDPMTDPEQQRALALFHGQWDQIEDPTPAEQAVIALERQDLINPILRDDQTPLLLRAQASLLKGETDQALLWLIDDTSAQAVVLKAKAYELLGQPDQAIQVLKPWRDRLTQGPQTDAAQLTAATQAVVVLARLEGRPARDFELAMSLFGKVHQQLDRLYWPALVAEAELLIDKDNAAEAVQALQDCLRLNPKCSRAWYRLGWLASRSYRFDAAARCVQTLRQIHRTHLLADRLEAEIYLTQKDPASALRVIAQGLERYPHQPDLLALLAAAKALAYDENGTREALEQFDERFEGNPTAYYTVGRFLSLARQYPSGATMLRRAIELSPNWPQPRIELGLLLMQAGDEAEANIQLQQAVGLDPFNRRANNQLKLAQQLLEFEQIRTEHFIIKYRPGVDEVLARDMPQQLEQIYRRVTGVYGYEPARPTVIEILPDEKSFGVRITGMPDIWTIAACTGDVIALTPPRDGASQRGPFDWPRVIGHEFVHTVTLNMTDYRIPHWLTEACAVWLEPGERRYEDCQLLAWAVTTDKLFDLDQINWAFIRPRNERDRPLAYAQASWMVEYLTERFGHDAVLTLLDQYRQANSNDQAIRQATGHDADEFMAVFRDWARQQVREWGLEKPPSDPRISSLLAEYESHGALDLRLLEQLLDEYPQHPGLLKLAARLAIETGEVDLARAAVMRYASVVPVDPWAQQELIQLAMRRSDPESAVSAMEQLDAQDVNSGQWAVRLTKIHRSLNKLDLAGDAIERALHRHPYNADYRELAATIELQRGEMDAAVHHLRALAILEPDRPIHRVRLAAIYSKLGRSQDAHNAAQEALRLDPDAPVSGYIEAQE